jgi:uncharacterized repeat protein (TIGR01451 family)
LVKTANVNSIALNGSVSFTMAVKNNGPGPAAGVLVTDDLPDGLAKVSISASQGSCAGTSCSIGSIPDGGSASVTLVATGETAGTKINTASVSQSQTDPVPANGTSSAAVMVLPQETPVPDVPAPESGEVNIAPGSGEGQCVVLKDEPGCQPLNTLEQLDINDIDFINPGTGKVQLQSIVGIGQFYGGPFSLNELPGTTASRATSFSAGKPVLLVKLVGGSFKQCATTTRALSSADAAAKKKQVRRLWGKGKGRFRTRGRYASGEVRGTNWLTQDFCDGTLVRVVTGVVQVRDFVLKQTVLLKAGQKYFANGKPKKP